MTKVLLVDDDEIARSAITTVLEESGFEVSNASNVPQALKLIAAERYDVLLQRPALSGGRGGTHGCQRDAPRESSGGDAVAECISREMASATQAILLQANEIVVEPMDLAQLVEVIKRRVAVGPVRNRVIVSVAQIVDRTAQSTSLAWCELVQRKRSFNPFR